MLRERVGDLTDVHIRVLSSSSTFPTTIRSTLPQGSNAILVTHDLTPSLTVQLDRSSIAAIATDAGTRTAHVAILARSFGLPAVVGLRDATARAARGEKRRARRRHRMLADQPDATRRSTPTTARSARRKSPRRSSPSSPALEAITLDGVRIMLRANVDIPEEAGSRARSGARAWG